MKQFEKMKEVLSAQGLGEIRIPKRITRNWSKEKQVDVDLITCGPVQAAFTSMEFTYRFGMYADGKITLEVHYSWTHPRGSNGYRVFIIFENDGSLHSIEG